MADLKNSEKIITGSIDSLLADVSKNMNVKLDRERFEFLRLISKTQYSGLTLTSLIASTKILQGKEERWFKELVEEGLAETSNFKSPNGKYDSKWEGWFITKKGRLLIKDVMNKMN